MKLVSLNTWGGAQGQIFFDFVKQHKKDTDIFCFQEVFSAAGDAPKVCANAHMHGFEEIGSLLPGFTSFFEAKSSGYAFGLEKSAEWPVNLGLAVFVRNDLKLLSYSGKIMGDAVTAGAPFLEGLIKIQVLTLANGVKQFHVINIHGMSRPGNKLDTPERLKQSEYLLEIMECLPKAPIILCGDFNLMPETQSVKMLEGKLENLIKVHNITNTRNEISWKKYNNRQSFADFTFVSPELDVKSFEVPYNLVSDHLPMILDFEFKD